MFEFLKDFLVFCLMASVFVLILVLIAGYFYDREMRKPEKRQYGELINRLRIRAGIRRQILTRKSVQEGKPDRLADLLDEAADAIERLSR